jgi:hypothetical protein
MPPRRERGSYFPELVVQVGAPAQFYPLRTQPLLRASRHLLSDRRRFALSSKSVACSVSPILRAASCSEHSLQGFPGSVAAWVQAVAPCGSLEMVQPQIDINRTLNTLGCVSGHFKPLLYLSGHTGRVSFRSCMRVRRPVCQRRNSHCPVTRLGDSIVDPTSPLHPGLAVFPRVSRDHC